MACLFLAVRLLLCQNPVANVFTVVAFALPRSSTLCASYFFAHPHAFLTGEYLAFVAAGRDLGAGGFHQIRHGALGEKEGKKNSERHNPDDVYRRLFGSSEQALKE